MPCILYEKRQSSNYFLFNQQGYYIHWYNQIKCFISWKYLNIHSGKEEVSVRKKPSSLSYADAYTSTNIHWFYYILTLRRGNCVLFKSCAEAKYRETNMIHKWESNNVDNGVNEYTRLSSENLIYIKFDWIMHSLYIFFIFLFFFPQYFLEYIKFNRIFEPIQAKLVWKGRKEKKNKKRAWAGSFLF